MTKILIDRTVVEQAVKALENRESTPAEYDAYHALRAALDQSPSSYPLPDELYDSKDWRAGGYAERVEWLHTMYESAKEQIAALCAALEQPKREPLVDEKILEISFAMLAKGSNMHDFARAIERAHDITGDQE